MRITGTGKGWCVYIQQHSVWDSIVYCIPKDKVVGLGALATDSGLEGGVASLCSPIGTSTDVE